MSPCVTAGRTSHPPGWSHSARNNLTLRQVSIWGGGRGKAPGDGVALGNWSALNNWGEDLTVQLWAEGAEDFLPAAIVDKVNKHEQINAH